MEIDNLTMDQLKVVGTLASWSEYYLGYRLAHEYVPSIKEEWRVEQAIVVDMQRRIRERLEFLLGKPCAKTPNEPVAASSVFGFSPLA